MKFLLFALIPLTGVSPYPTNTEPIFRSSQQSPALSHSSHSNADYPGHCENGWAYFDETDACYKNFFWATFNNAETLCNIVGGHLASIHSFKENSFVAELARTGNTISGYPQTTWIGLVRADYINSSWTAQWMWTDNTEVDYLAWDVGEPNNGGGVQRCVEIIADPLTKNGDLSLEKWSDIGCNINLRSFVCKKKALH